MRRVYSSRFQCGHPGCPELAFFESPTRADQANISKRYHPDKWRCTRHTSPDEVLSPDSLRRTAEIVSRETAGGRYFGSFGLVTGPGFKIFAKDFPVGTTLRVTAEAILPPSNVNKCPACQRMFTDGETCSRGGCPMGGDF